MALALAGTSLQLQLPNSETEVEKTAGVYEEEQEISEEVLEIGKKPWSS